MPILKFDKFNEKLGVIEGLDEIADRIMNRLSETDEYEDSVEINGEEIKFTVKMVRDNPVYVARCIASPKDGIQLLLTPGTTKYSIIHELKHLYQHIQNGYKRNRIDLLNAINHRLDKKFNYLINKDDAENLIGVIYLANQHEFEAYYNQYYYHMKETLEEYQKKNSITLSEKDRKGFVNAYLRQTHIYNMYNKIYNDPYNPEFSVASVFKTKAGANKYIRKLLEYEKSAKKFHDDGTYWVDPEIDKAEKYQILHKIKDIYHKWIKDDELDASSIKNIDDEIRRSVKRNYKKFHRLYTLIV